MTLLRRLAGGILLVAALLVVAPLAAAAAPQIGAPSAAVIEVSTGTVLFQKNADERRAMASTTKLMTALVARDEEKLGTIMRATGYVAAPVETQLGLRPGERISVADLIRALLLASANDAAHTLAVRVGDSTPRFADLMNEKAAQLGLADTNFVNAIGLDAPGHRTTALDLAKIGAEAHRDDFLRGVVRQSRLTLKSLDDPRTVVNRNRTLGIDLGGGARIDGMKTGHTQRSGYSLVGSATRGGVTVVSTVLGASSEAMRDADTEALLRWASRLMVRRTLAEPTQVVARAQTERGKEERVALVPARAVREVVARGARVELQPVGVPAIVEAPIAAGRPLGTARIMVNGREAGTVGLVARDAVERRSLPAHLWHSAVNRWQLSLVALVLLLAGSLMLVHALRGRKRSRLRTPGAPTQLPTQ